MEEVRKVVQGEGCEQGDPLMPLLFSLGQHRAFVLIQAQLKDGERMFAFLNHLYVVCGPERFGEVYFVLEQQLREKPGIIHHGKTKLWNKAGVKPAMCDVLTQAARAQKPQAIVWRSDWSLPKAQQGLKVLGVPVGHPSFIAAQMTSKLKEQAVLFERIPLIDDVQVGWLLLVFCAATRANYWLRTVLPEHTDEYARGHDGNVLQCLSSILQLEELPSHSHEVASVPLTLGGLVWVSVAVRRSCIAAHWGSWADCLWMIQQRHPWSAEARPPWDALAEGLRPQTGVAEREPSQVSHGWQKYAAEAVHEHFGDHVVWPRLSPDQRALVRSQSGPLPSVSLTALPVHRVSKMDSEPFRVLLLRCLRMPLPFTVCTCRVAVHSTLLATTAQRAVDGVLGRRGIAAENAIAQICREGGAPVSTNVILRDLDITPTHRSDARRFEVIAEGLTLFGGFQLAIDATVVSPLHADGSTHRRKADTTDGQALAEARTRKDHTQSCAKGMVARGWSWSLARSEADGRRKPRISCGAWQVRRPLVFPEGFKGAHEQRGTDAGVVFCCVPRRSQSPRLCRE